jgi:hypothetical protein
MRVRIAMQLFFFAPHELGLSRLGIRLDKFFWSSSKSNAGVSTVPFRTFGVRTVLKSRKAPSAPGLVLSIWR